MKNIINVGSRMKKNFVAGANASLDSNFSIAAAGIVGAIEGFQKESVIEGVLAAGRNYVYAAGLTGVINVIMGEIDNLRNK